MRKQLVGCETVTTSWRKGGIVQVDAAGVIVVTLMGGVAPNHFERQIYISSAQRGIVELTERRIDLWCTELSTKTIGILIYRRKSVENEKKEKEDVKEKQTKKKQKENKPKRTCHKTQK